MTPIQKRKHRQPPKLPHTRHQCQCVLVQLLLFFCSLSLSQTIHAQSLNSDISDEEWEKWLADDAEEKARRVNEGEIHFLPKAPEDTNSHAIENHIEISTTSLTDQWVSFRQCHTHLDPVAQTQIVYRYKNMRNLRIEHAEGIAKTWVENQSIQMEDLQDGASICILAEAQIFKPVQVEGYNAFFISNGPYYRKFLDGYYPFHLRFTITYPADLLSVVGASPKPQAGVVVSQKPGYIHFDIWFEGELKIGILFQPIADTHP